MSSDPAQNYSKQTKENYKANKKQETTNKRRPTNHRQAPKQPSNNTPKTQPKRGEEIEKSNSELHQAYLLPLIFIPISDISHIFY